MGQQNSTLLGISGCVNGIDCQFVIDTGAEFSFMSEGFIRYMKLKYSTNNNLKNKKVTGIGGCKILGITDKFEIVLPSGECIIGSFYVIDSNTPAVIGLDILHEQNAIIDIVNRTVKLRQHTIKCLPEVDLRPHSTLTFSLWK